MRCLDARVSCPASYTCTNDNQCLASDGSRIASTVNVDASDQGVEEDGICGAINSHFSLPNFCVCTKTGVNGDGRYKIGPPNAGIVECSVGIGGAEIVANVMFEPCQLSYFSYDVHVKASQSPHVWSRSKGYMFQETRTIASMNIALARGSVRSEAAGKKDVWSNYIRDLTFSIGFCAENGSTKECNPQMSSGPSLPIHLLKGNRDFTYINGGWYDGWRCPRN